MLTNTERQQIVEEVNAGTYGIDEALDDIAAAQKGEEVRKALYAEALVLNREGHAGSTDMIARQKIANLQTSVNGQISTLRTEVGEDIDDLETALNSGLATQNGKIAAQNATIAGVVANYNVEYGSTELWASTGETGALAAGTTVTLSEDVSHFDYIDIYSFCGNSNVLDTVPVDAKLQSNAGYALRWVNLSDPDSGSYKAYVRIIETRLHIIGTTLTIDHQVTYRNGEEVNISGAEITQSNRSTYMGELGIMKIVGRKIAANTEIEDVRIGADGTEYASAGQAVRAQVTALESAIPAVDSTLSTQGAAADAKVAGDKVADLKSAIGNESKVITGAFPNSQGVIEASSAWDCYCFKCTPGGFINSIILGESSQQLIFAFYATEPAVGSVSNNNSRFAMGPGVITATNIKVPNTTDWIVVRVAKSDKPRITLAKVSDINSSLINRVGNISVNDLNDISENTIYYVSKDIVSENFPAGYSVGYVTTIILSTANKLQVFFAGNGSGSVQRACVNGTWSSWEKLGQKAANALESRAFTYTSPGGITDANSITDIGYAYLSANIVSNLPGSGAWYVWTVYLNSQNIMQLAFSAYGTNPYIRAKVEGTWGTWERIGKEAAKEAAKEAVDNLFVTSTIALFPTVGCCGDSFTAGYLYNKPESQWYDPNYVPNGEYPAIGYPAVMGRLYGINVTSYAKGGLTSTAYRTDNMGLPAILADDPKYLYIIALGLNDKTQNIPLGVAADIDAEPDTPTYLGNMGAIIRAIQNHAPYARIILCKSLWMNTTYYNYISEGVELLSSHLGIPFIETKGDPYFESSAYKDGLKGLHPTAPLYAGIGKRIGELIGKIVIDNPDYFYNFYVPNS